jgi:glycosyltransferase involved in cell wall biosynthesis
VVGQVQYHHLGLLRAALRGKLSSPLTADGAVSFRMTSFRPSTTPFVSILVPTHDNPEMIRQVVPGVLENTRLPFELIVLDNASCLPEVVSYLEEIATLPHVKVVRCPENRFYWPAINDGLRHCERSCSWLVALNDDCVILGPSWIERLIASFDDRREVGFVGDLMSDSLFPSLPPLVDGYCTMFRREIFDMLGVFDERYPFWWGFADFQIRARRRGIRGGDIKHAGDRHHFIAGVVHHLRGRTLAGIQERMTPADQKRLFGDSFTKARVLLKNGYYGHAAKLLVNQAVTAIEGS